MRFTLTVGRVRTVLFTLAATALPRLALACPVCFGQSDSTMAIATNKGVITLLVVIVGVLAAFASFFIHLARRARLAEVPGSTEPARFVGSNPEEGTAQC